MEEMSLQVEIRKMGTKGGLNDERAARKIPGVVYGGDKPSVPVFVSEKDFLKVRGSGKSNAVVTLKHAQGTDTVILKAVQRHPVSHQFTHVDFQRISLKKEIEVKVPVRITGEAPGVKLHGGILEHILREIQIKCLPTAIPDALTVDVSSLDIGHALHVRDLTVPAGIAILSGPELVLITVVAPKAEEVAEPAAAVPGAAEPEVLTAKGKKEEEGAAPAGEKGKAPEKGGKEGGEKK